MSVFLTWLATFLEGLLVPLIEKWVAKTEVSRTVSQVQAQQDALIKAVGELQTAKTPEEFANAIKDVAAANNLHSK